jgi:alpha-tubulin suppressor-like RCC1 family protein
MANLRKTILLTGGLWLSLLGSVMLAPPASAASRVTAVGDSSCAIASDGALQCWGIDAPFDKVPGRAVFIEGFSDDLVAITGPAYSLCGLTASGGVLCKGYYPGDGVSDYTETPLAPVGLSSGVTDVSRSNGHVCAVKDDGSVWCWGTAWYGLGDDTVTTYSLAPIEVLPASFHAHGISLGPDFACVWNQSGELRCWGANYYGQVGVGNVGDTINTPTAVAGIANVLSVDTDLDHSCAVVVGGVVYCWGQNNYGQLGDNTYTNTESPVLASNFGGINADSVFTGFATTCIQSQAGMVTCNGFDYSGQIAPSGTLQADAGQLAMGDEHGCALVDGQAECWGNNAFGQLGVGYPGNEYGPVRNLAANPAHAPRTYFMQGCVADTSGSAFCWGTSYLGSGESAPLDPLSLHAVQNTGGTVTFAATGSAHQCVLRSDGKVACWGINLYGALGHGALGYLYVPTPHVVDSIGTSAIQLAAGNYHNCALLADKTVACWGFNYSGQSGVADYENVLTPTIVAGLSNIEQISVDSGDNCAVNGSGEIWCWGSNNHGQLGNGDLSLQKSAAPVKVNGLPALAMQVSVARSYACAVLVNGKIACWGQGVYGNLGNGDWNDHAIPVLVDSSETFEQVAAGDTHTCARTASNDVYCWGDGTYGQLGVGMLTGTTLPLKVDIKAIDIDAGDETTCALGTDNKAYCWGANESAQLGIGRRGISEEPMQVVGFGDHIFANGFEAD